MDKICLAYLRISSEEQSAFSLQNQREYVKREANTRGYILPDENIFEDDGYSAKTTNRPGLIKMLTLAKTRNSNICALIIYKVDRLSRDTADYLGIKKILAEKAITIVSCTEPVGDNPAEAFIETILSAAAQYDNAIKSERVKSSMKLRINSGLPPCKAPPGYLNFTKPDGKRIVVKDPESFELIKTAWHKMESGAYSLKVIAKYLNDNGFKTRRTANGLTKQSVNRIFANKTYCGYAISKKNNLEVKSDKIPQMISEDTFYKVRSVLMGRTSSPEVYQKQRPEFPLKGFLLCSTCLQPMRAGFTKGRNRHYGYYFCQAHAKPSIPVQDVDNSLLKLLRVLTPDPLLRKIFLEDLKRKYNEQFLSHFQQESRIEKDIQDLKEQRTLAARKALTGKLSEELAKEVIDQIEIELITKKTIKSESKLAQLDIEVLITFMNGFLSDLGKVYLQESSLELKRMFIGSIFVGKLIFKNGVLEPLELASAYQVLEAMAKQPVPLCARERT